MTLEILTVDKFACKEQFLQHITRLIQIKLTPTDTYLDLFKKLEEMFPEGEERKAIDEFIQFNIDQAGMEALDSIIDEDDNMYAIFNLKY
jgi:hypothetical protein